MLLLNVGGGVDVDITRVPLDQYRTLSQGDRVVVVGIVSRDNRRVFASSRAGIDREISRVAMPTL